MRRTAVLLLFVTLSLSAATPKPKPAAAPKPKPAATVAPGDLPHAFAQLLRALSKDGGRAVTFRATATGTRFFFEEPSGVTVYRFEKGRYVRETFLRGSKLAGALKKYAKK